jgi:hypothetical protein
MCPTLKEVFNMCPTHLAFSSSPSPFPIGKSSFLAKLPKFNLLQTLILNSSLIQKSLLVIISMFFIDSFK